jgi:hypothetical protein
MPTRGEKLQTLRSEVRDKLRHMEYMSCYAAAVARRVRKHNFAAKIVVAAAACVPFMAKIQEVSSDTASWATALVPLVALTLPIWNPDKILEAASKLHGGYSELLPPLRSLWRRLRDFSDEAAGNWQEVAEAAHKQLAEIEERASSFAAEVRLLPEVESLKMKCSKSIPSYEDEKGGSAPNMGPGAVVYSPMAHFDI